MGNLKKNLAKQFANCTLHKNDLQQIKGGKKLSKEEKELKKRCEKAWKNAREHAKRYGGRIKKINGNGNGIW